MPTDINNPSRTGHSGDPATFDFHPLSQNEADRMPSAAKLGSFLVESGSGRLLAMDAQATAQFSIGSDATNLFVTTSGPDAAGSAAAGSADTGSGSAAAGSGSGASGPNTTDSDATASDVTSTNDRKANRLHPLFPNLSEAEWISLTHPKDNQVRSLSTLVQRSDGSKLLAKLNFLPLSGIQQDFLLLSIDALAAKPEAIVHRDALTGLPDRRELVKHHQFWRQSTGDKLNSLALLFMDLDQFKQINDQYGHTVGDQVLVALASRWQNCVRGGDIVVRYGGDEFVVMLAGITKREDVAPVFARLTKATADPILVGREQLTIGVTIGVALCDSTTTNLEQLIHAADLDMYASKRHK